MNTSGINTTTVNEEAIKLASAAKHIESAPRTMWRSFVNRHMTRPATDRHMTRPSIDRTMKRTA